MFYLFDLRVIAFLMVECVHLNTVKHFMWESYGIPDMNVYSHILFYSMFIHTISTILPLLPLYKLYENYEKDGKTRRLVRAS